MLICSENLKHKQLSPSLTLQTSFPYLHQCLEAIERSLEEVVKFQQKNALLIDADGKVET
ncbi:CLUMA_CG014663, isoform A [Clunio marinus]|uniref:CLUMA_CG014663, isoform A n=1 Tax=Clunio marinus TaxID=568069 RepID=A0A1J1IM36_9DIPT|nr:CLUMA_CG014663, isoform A [Clunio marinus]